MKLTKDKPAWLVERHNEDEAIKQDGFLSLKPSEIDTWIDNNVNNVDDVRRVLKKYGRLISRLYRDTRDQ